MFSRASAGLAPQAPVDTPEEAAYRDAQILARCHVLSPWGLAVAIDLGGCDLRQQHDGEQLERFAAALCDLIDARPLAPTQGARADAGLRRGGVALVQQIEGGLIAVHLVEERDSVYIDILSARPYRPYLTADFCRRWFEAATVRVGIALRQAAPADDSSF